MQIGVARPELSFDIRNLGPAAGDSRGHLLAFLGDLFERAAIALQHCLPSRQPLPSLHDHVHVLRIEFYSVTDALGDFRGGERAPRSEEEW
jgi:hypothetical protein